jgi:heme-degrading monooxygenase HmoA
MFAPGVGASVGERTLPGMIIRVFEAEIRAGRFAEFEELIRTVSLPLVEAQAGIIYVRIGRPLGTNSDTFVMVSVWRDLEDLKGFTGDDWDRPVIPDEREAAIIVRSTVRHFEAIEP